MEEHQIQFFDFHALFPMRGCLIATTSHRAHTWAGDLGGGLLVPDDEQGRAPAGRQRRLHGQAKQKEETSLQTRQLLLLLARLAVGQQYGHDGHDNDADNDDTNNLTPW